MKTPGFAVFDPPAGRMEEIPAKKSTLDRLETRINAAGIATRRNYIRTESGSAPVLIADHDYTGTVDRVAARYKGLRLERRGYYQATFIWEEVAPA